MTKIFVIINTDKSEGGISISKYQKKKSGSTPAEPKSKKHKQPVSQAKRRRDSLMSDNRNRFVISKKDRQIHDRTCSCAALIEDADFDMLRDFVERRELCPECCRKAFIRNGLPPEMSKYIDAAANIFEKLCAPKTVLKRLFVDNAAKIETVRLDAICIRVQEDSWLFVPYNGCTMLYHNSYTKVKDGEQGRVMAKGQFHQHSPHEISFKRAVDLVLKYRWHPHSMAGRGEKYDIGMPNIEIS